MMEMNKREFTVPMEDVGKTIQQANDKGWQLSGQTQTEDGQVRLEFVPKMNMAMAAAGQYGGMPVPKPPDPNMAWLELLGLFGFLGVGYLVTNRVNDGIIRLVGFLAFVFIGWFVASLLTIIVIGLCMMPFLLLAQIAIPIWSALTLRGELEAEAAAFYQNQSRQAGGMV